MHRLHVEELKVSSFPTEPADLSVSAVTVPATADPWSPLCMDTMQAYCKETQVAAAE
jgi:hypothetical protein